MAGLQRSTTSFRRQGSSGLIWDDKLLSGELKRFPQGKPSSSDSDHVQTSEKNQSNCSKTAIGPVNTVRRSRSSNCGKASPATEPPSPRVPVCGLCRGFGKHNKTRSRTGSRT